MTVNPLSPLGETYADTLVGLERFARLLDMPSAALRARRKVDQPFPNSAGSSPFGRYRLGELVEWAGAVELADRADPIDIRRLALECAVRKCARAHGSEATHRFVGGVALMIAAGWRPGPPGRDPRPIVQRLRSADPDGWKPPLAQVLVDRGFVPDAHPAHDQRVRNATLEWRGSRSGEMNDRRSPLVVPDDSADAANVVTEIASLANLVDVDDFATEIDQYVLEILRSRDRQHSSSPRMVAATMAAVAMVKPGDIVCDPAMGEASTLIELVARTNTARTQTIGVAGREMEEYAWTVAKIRLGVRGIAHELATPGFDSLAKNAFSESFDVVLCEPAAGRRDYRVWFELCRRILEEHGTGVLALGADLLRSSSIGGWWFTESEFVGSLVITPTSRTRRKGAPTAILTIDPRMAKELRTVIVSERATRSDPNRPDRMLAPMDRAQVEAIRAFVVDGRPPDAADLALETATSVTGMASIDETIEVVLGPPPEARTVDEANPERITEDRSPNVDRRYMARERHATRTQATEAVQLLRWLLDPDDEIDALPLDPETRNALAGLSTDEVRRALKRLDQRLQGVETRGRRSPAKPRAPRPDQDPPA